jgi:hypothetical protein
VKALKTENATNRDKRLARDSLFSCWFILSPTHPTEIDCTVGEDRAKMESLRMSTTITIPTELEERIAERAAAQGKDINEFALEALERAAATVSLRELFADVHTQVHESGLSEKEIDARIQAAVNEVRERRRA